MKKIFSMKLLKVRNKIVENTKNLKRNCGGKEVIMEFALGAIAVVLAMVFREQIENVISTVGNTFSTRISSLFQGL